MKRTKHVLRKELQDRIDAQDHDFEWGEGIRDIETLTETEIQHHGKTFLIRSAAQRTCGKVFQAVGVALPPTVRQIPTGARGVTGGFAEGDGSWCHAQIRAPQRAVIAELSKIQCRR